MPRGIRLDVGLAASLLLAVGLLVGACAGDDVRDGAGPTEGSRTVGPSGSASSIPAAPTPLSPALLPTATPFAFPSNVPDGALLFSARANGSYDLFRVDADGSSLLRLTSHPGYEEPGAWSPDGTTIAFSRNTAINDNIDIYFANPDGSDARNITDMPELREVFVSWSPDGALILFGYFSECCGEWWIMRPDGSDRRMIVAACQCFAPQWLPDGRRLLAQRADLADRSQLYVSIVNADGTIERDVAAPKESWLNARPSPDGRTIAYTRRGPTTQDLLVQDVASGSDRLLWTGTPGLDLAWSPDGAEIAFAAKGTSDEPTSPPVRLQFLTVLEIATATERRLASSGTIGGIEWAPDGTRVAFHALGPGPYSQADVFVVSREGGAPINVSTSDWEDSMPVWSPDGTQIMFRSLRTTLDGLYWLDPDTGEYGRVDPLLADDAGLELPVEGGCVHPLTPDGGALGQACLSPDGTLRATYRYEDAAGRREQYVSVTEEATGVEVSRSRLGGLVSSRVPAWSPDGQYVAFVSGREDARLYRMDVQSGAIEALAEADVTPSEVIWSEDSTYIYFTRGGLCRGGCAPGFLFRVPADGPDEASQLLEFRAYRLFGFR